MFCVVSVKELANDKENNSDLKQCFMLMMKPHFI